MDPVGPGDGEHRAGPAHVVIKPTGEHTRGSFFLAEAPTTAFAQMRAPECQSAARLLGTRWACPSR